MRWPWSRKQRVNFDSAPRPIVEMFAELYNVSGTSVTRAAALSVPAVRKGRNMLCAIATMPLEQLGPDNTVVPSPLLRQIDPDVADVVTKAQTIEDLLFEGIAWWLVTSTDFAGFPASARHLDVSKVSLNPPAGRKPPLGDPSPLPSGAEPRGAVVWVDGQPVAASRIIRFDSPNPGVLHHAGREIRRAILLDRAAGMYADDPRPLDYFTSADGADPVDDDEVEQILAKWKANRKRRSTAYIPVALTYNTVDTPSPQQLQLAELGKQANLDIANSLGVDPEDLGISTTSRTYSNDVDRRRNRINDVLSPYMSAITDRLGMGDVTRRGYTTRFNTTEYLLPNPVDRWSIYSTAKGLGAMTVEEIREAEGMPPMPEQPEAEAEPADEPAEAESEEATVTPIDASRRATHTFDADPAGMAMTADLPVVEFSVDRDTRIVEGVVLPYGKFASQYGQKFRFEKGALKWDAANPGRVKLLRDHDMRQPLGVAVQLKDTAAGMRARFKLARGDAADEALALAEDGVLDGFSVGVDFDMATDTVPDPRDKGAVLIRRADWRETSLTAMPSFDDARVTKVAAARTGGGHVADTDTDPAAPAVEPPAAVTDPPAPDPAVVEAAAEPAALTLSADQVAALSAVPGGLAALFAQPAASEAPAPTATATLQLTVDQVLAMGRQMGPETPATPAAPPAVEGPTPVDPTRSLNLAVTGEALPYRFDRGGRFQQGEHEFSTDLVDAVKRGDFDGTGSEAGKRVMATIRAKFADVDVADVNELNPDIQRPDMYVPQRDFRYPIWEAIQKGAPPNGVQPFVFPKFSSASGLVGDHTEGTEPTGGTFVTTSQTVTPTALSGKASLTREIWDTGGNPAVSTLIWDQMQRSWREGLESAAATFLNTLTAATDINLGVAVLDEALAAAWDLAIAALQFVRGYDFDTFVIEQQLYEAFVDATATDGRKIYPQLNPQNATGSSSRRFSQLDLAGVVGIPSWALTATEGAANNSWLFDPMTVHGWASPPQRLDLPGSGGAAGGVESKPLAYVDIGIWGYKAFANSDVGGVRQVIYDNA